MLLTEYKLENFWVSTFIVLCFHIPHPFSTSAPETYNKLLIGLLM
jgi:hypothetical protein